VLPGDVCGFVPSTVTRVVLDAVLFPADRHEAKTKRNCVRYELRSTPRIIGTVYPVTRAISSSVSPARCAITIAPPRVRLWAVQAGGDTDPRKRP
jgi:hypothetical protein